MNYQQSKTQSKKVYEVEEIMSEKNSLQNNLLFTKNNGTEDKNVYCLPF